MDNCKSTSDIWIFFGFNLVICLLRNNHKLLDLLLELNIKMWSIYLPKSFGGFNHYSLNWVFLSLKLLSFGVITFNSIVRTANPILHVTTKHIKLDLYFVWEKVLDGQITCSSMSSTSTWAVSKSATLLKLISQAYQVVLLKIFSKHPCFLVNIVDAYVSTY